MQQRLETKAQAHGKWRGLLNIVGMTDSQLSGVHQPCPICAGKDRFRFTDYKSGGEYFCSGCGAGDGFDLLMGMNGWNFSETAKEVDRMLGNDIPQVFAPKIDVEKRRRDLNDIWASAKVQVVATHYLKGRGIDGPVIEKCSDLRGHAGLYLKDDPEKQPAMLALVRNKEGVPVSIHRTYVNKRIRKLMPPTEKITGAAIRLGGLADTCTVVIGEGVETTLSGIMYCKCPGMATISANGMETVEVPKHITNVFILCDNDTSWTGQKAAFTLAKRMGTEGRMVEVIMPSARDRDMNDYHDPESEGLIDLHEWSNK